MRRATCDNHEGISDRLNLIGVAVVFVWSIEKPTRRSVSSEWSVIVVDDITEENCDRRKALGECSEGERNWKDLKLTSCFSLA